jgi:hypothetical protein
MILPGFDEKEIMRKRNFVFICILFVKCKNKYIIN